MLSPAPIHKTPNKHCLDELRAAHTLIGMSDEHLCYLWHRLRKGHLSKKA